MPPLPTPCPRLIVAAVFALLTGAAHAQMVAESIGQGIVRFHASADARDNALPSFSLLQEPPTNPAPADFPVTPTYATDDAGRHLLTIEIEDGTSLYGTGEVPGPLLRNGRTTTLWNTDAYGYGNDSPSLYQSHPWVLAVRADGTSFGVLADTTYRTTIDLTESITFIAEGPAFPTIVIERDHPKDVVTALADLTGKMAMPPLWALGYHQCRYSYEPDERVREVAQEFRSRNIPCDVIWMDIDYMHGFRCFTFDPNRFPNPSELNNDLHDMGFHSVWMIDPGIKAEQGYFVYDEGTAGDHWVRTARGEPYTGTVWPGDCVFPDFTRQATREWWASLYADFLAHGIDGVWNDMNEPAVFGVESKTMPEDNLHRADSALGGPGPHARFHNVYGRLMIEATRNGVLAARPDKRPFVLSRASFMGGQRFGATWSGDNTADWDHLEWSIPMTLNLGLSGQPFSGPDIGGFVNDGDGALFARWMGIGAFLPFARGHTGKGNVDKEPWSFGPEVEKTCRIALERRMRLMPYLYTLFHEATQTGMPIVRPVFFADPTDPALRSEDDAFLLGDDILVVPQVTPGRDREPVMPKGIWRELKMGETTADLPKLFIRGGAIVPMTEPKQFADGELWERITVWICLDEDGEAEGSFYEDRGEGFGYRDGEYALTTFRARGSGAVGAVQHMGDEGDLDVSHRIYDGWAVGKYRINVRIGRNGRGQFRNPGGQ